MIIIKSCTWVTPTSLNSLKLYKLENGGYTLEVTHHDILTTYDFHSLEFAKKSYDYWEATFNNIFGEKR